MCIYICEILATMSVAAVSAGRTWRAIPPKLLAFKQLNFVEKKVQKQKHLSIDMNNKIVISFFMITLGGTLSTIATIYNNRPLWWAGIAILVSVSIALVIIHSSLNSPCSPQ